MTSGMDKPTRLPIILQRHDQLKHFSNNGPVTKLVALLLLKLPAILMAAGSLAVGLAKINGWL